MMILISTIHPITKFLKHIWLVGATSVFALIGINKYSFNQKMWFQSPLYRVVDEMKHINSLVYWAKGRHGGRPYLSFISHFHNAQPNTLQQSLHLSQQLGL